MDSEEGMSVLGGGGHVINLDPALELNQPLCGYAETLRPQSMQAKIRLSSKDRFHVNHPHAVNLSSR